MNSSGRGPRVRVSISGSLRQVVYVDEIKPGGEARPAHRYQTDLRGRTEGVRPHAAPDPMRAVVARVGAVNLHAIPAALDDTQVRPLTGRADQCAAIAGVAVRHRTEFLGKLAL